MEITVMERVILFLRYLKIGQNAFEAKVGWSNGYISNTKNLSADKLTNVLNEYPLLNAEWLLTGKGSMIKDRDDKINSADVKFINNEFLLERFEVIVRENENLRNENELLKKGKSNYNNDVRSDLSVAEP